MNPDLCLLQPYPFEKLAQLKQGVIPPQQLSAINLALGEPQDDTPNSIVKAMDVALRQGLKKYPTTLGSEPLRHSIARWLIQRFNLPADSVDPNKHILPVNGTREALFAFAQCVINRQAPDPLVLIPNPFYQIYEGATLLAGAKPWFINCSEATQWQPDFASIPETVWARCQLLYLCSPNNPSGTVLSMFTWHHLLAYADKYDFIIAADECYSEIYADENQLPISLLQANLALGRVDFNRVSCFTRGMYCSGTTYSYFYRKELLVLMNDLKNIIEPAFENRAELNAHNVNYDLKTAVKKTLNLLDQGTLRVAEKRSGQWVVNEWLKKAVLLSFRLEDNCFIKGGFTNYYDKVAPKFADVNSRDFQDMGVRVVPPATVRRGAYVAPGVVLMPSYVNIGAYVDSSTMVDTWATVGSCAQIGKNVHLSGGVGIGGVLEPIQAAPTIIEDNCFIGARSEIVEGVIVGEGSVISMGVYIGQSTKIYNRDTKEITYGYIPPGSVVVSGNLPSTDGKYSLYCAVIVKQVDEKTRSKVGLNELLRDI